MVSSAVTVALLGLLAAVSAQQTMILVSQGRDQSPRTFGPCDNQEKNLQLPGCQVDFEWGNKGWETGIVQNQLNLATRVPIYCCGNGLSPLGTVHNQTTFDTWFNDSPKTKDINHNLTLVNTQANPRVYGFDDQSYFPYDGMGWDVPAGTDEYLALDGNMHNFHFCNEAHGRFAYKGGEEFNFVGDDDVFVFINNQLAMDLGGVHGPVTGSFNLDDIAAAFGLVLGNNYRFDFFWCERHTLGSDIKLSTSLEIFCSYYDWCDQCDGNGQSCCNTTQCSDGNPCTVDLCEVLVAPTVGCQHLAVNCTVPDICHTSACSPLNGQCVDTPISCPSDNNPCTVDSCAADQGGCIYPQKVCEDTLGLCTLKSCDPTSGNCVFTPVNCDDGNACTDDNCVPAVGCVHTATVCNDHNNCTIDTCNTTSGCVFTPSDCGCDAALCPTTDPCSPNTCSVNAAGQKVCALAPITCNDNNPCTTDLCSSTTGVAVCSNTPVTCTGTPCSPGVCNMTTGTCFTQPVNCDDGILCTIDSCNATTGACLHTLRVCNDNNACTDDTCQNTASSPDGCVYTPIVCQNTTCSVSTCNPLYGCVPMQSDRCNVFSNTSYCQAATCDESVGCLNTTRTCLLQNELSDPTHWVDNYQNMWKVSPSGQKYKDNDCFTATCDPVQDKCVVSQLQPWSSTCNFAYLSQGEQAGILSAGIIAGIVIAAVVFAALAGFGAKKGYDAWVRMHDERMGAAQGNPMYAPSAGSGNNAMYS